MTTATAMDSVRGESVHVGVLAGADVTMLNLVLRMSERASAAALKGVRHLSVSLQQMAEAGRQLSSAAHLLTRPNAVENSKIPVRHYGVKLPGQDGIVLEATLLESNQANLGPTLSHSRFASVVPNSTASLAAEALAPLGTPAYLTGAAFIHQAQDLLQLTTPNVASSSGKLLPTSNHVALLGKDLETSSRTAPQLFEVLGSFASILEAAGGQSPTHLATAGQLFVSAAYDVSSIIEFCNDHLGVSAALAYVLQTQQDPDHAVQEDQLAYAGVELAVISNITTVVRKYIQAEQAAVWLLTASKSRKLVQLAVAMEAAKADTGARQTGLVRLTHISFFTRARGPCHAPLPLKAYPEPDSGNTRAALVIQRALDALGPFEYDLVACNCEHVAKLVLYGVPSSTQVKVASGGVFRGVVGAGCLGLAGIAALMFPPTAALFGSAWLGSAACAVGLSGATTLVGGVSTAAAVGTGIAGTAGGALAGVGIAHFLQHSHKHTERPGQADEDDMLKQTIFEVLQPT